MFTQLPYWLIKYTLPEWYPNAKPNQYGPEAALSLIRKYEEVVPDMSDFTSEISIIIPGVANTPRNQNWAFHIIILQIIITTTAILELTLQNRGTVQFLTLQRQAMMEEI